MSKTKTKKTTEEVAKVTESPSENLSVQRYNAFLKHLEDQYLWWGHIAENGSVPENQPLSPREKQRAENSSKRPLKKIIMSAEEYLGGIPKKYESYAKLENELFPDLFRDVFDNDVASLYEAIASSKIPLERNFCLFAPDNVSTEANTWPPELTSILCKNSSTRGNLIHLNVNLSSVTIGVGIDIRFRNCLAKNQASLISNPSGGCLYLILSQYKYFGSLISCKKTLNLSPILSNFSKTTDLLISFKFGFSRRKFCKL